MTVNVSFSELSNYVAAHYGRKLGFRKISGNEFMLIYYQKILIKEVAVSIDIKIEAVSATSVTFSYEGNKAVELVVAGALNFVKDKYPLVGNALEIKDCHVVCLNFNKFPKAKAITDNLTLKSISVADNGFIIEAELK